MAEQRLAASSGWPSSCASPQEILTWLNQLPATDGLTGRCLLGMRWLVLAELERVELGATARAAPATAAADAHFLPPCPQP